jgi:hypothetical protein
MDEAGEIDEKTVKLYYFNKYWKDQTQTVKLANKTKKLEQLARQSHLLLDV